MGPTFGGINLRRYARMFYHRTTPAKMDIPVFHDDCSTAVTAAGLINALKISGKGNRRRQNCVGMVPVRQASCALNCLNQWATHNNCIMCDTKGVIYQGRTEGLNQWDSAHAAATDNVPGAGN
jgi:malate dehydrogenase (oxaloacetate-decarboxylating)(NADP+)